MNEGEALRPNNELQRTVPISIPLGASGERPRFDTSFKRPPPKPPLQRVGDEGSPSLSPHNSPQTIDLTPYLKAFPSPKGTGKVPPIVPARTQLPHPPLPLPRPTQPLPPPSESEPPQQIPSSISGGGHSSSLPVISRRQRIAQELLTTERTYVRNLQLVIEVSFRAILTVPL